MTTSADLSGLDQTQVKLMEEECILINDDDQNIGSASKKVCHSMVNINQGDAMFPGFTPMSADIYSISL